MKKKIAIIGTTSYLDKMLVYKAELEKDDYFVRAPAFDFHPEFNELQICEFNREMIEWADEVHIFWDQRSMGTVFDFGMCFMAQKPVKVVYLESKTLKNVMLMYEQLCSMDETPFMIQRKLFDC